MEPRRFFNLFTGPTNHRLAKDINSGGRAIPGFCRPHFISVAGTPLKMEFNPKKGTFLFEFDGDVSIDAPDHDLHSQDTISNWI